MTEIGFPLLGAAFVVLVILPAFALLAKAGLTLLESDHAGGPLQRLNLRYLLLTGSTVLPLAWFCSAGLHQVESGKSALACLFDHAASARCLEPGFFALTLCAIALACSTSVLRGLRGARPRNSSDANDLRVRIERLVLDHPMLAGVRGKIVATNAPGFAIGTYGWIRPQVFLGVAFASRLSDDMLMSALGHECEHARSLDPLRYLLLQLALAANPLGRFLLEPHVTRWYAALEAHCDREAVIRGALPLPLADAIVRAARPTASEAVALGARDTSVLKFRISMLLAFAERMPSRRGEHGPWAFPMTFVLLLVTLLLPHQTSTGALDALHTGAERALTYLWD